MPAPIVQIDRLSHRYGDRLALSDLSLAVDPGEIFGFLGPNGSGKTTLFRILSTLLPAPPGAVRILLFDPATHTPDIRRHIGVVFQSPALDRQLSARENLMHHGHLYGLHGSVLRDRTNHILSRLNLLDRADQRVETFSGGMRRRVELAKGLLNQPRLLILDEPSTGLDPGARIDLWDLLRDFQKRDGVTILLTTHLMDEADKCSRLAILDQGKLVAMDTPTALKQRIGADVIQLTSSDPRVVQNTLREKFAIQSELIDGNLRFEQPSGHQFVPRIIEAMPGMIDSISVGKPTLEDVFIHATGHRFRDPA